MPNSLGEYQLYPRGFLGVPLGTGVARKVPPFSELNNALQYDVSILNRQEKQRPGNARVEKLYTALTRGERHIDSAKFREELFEVFFSAFGTSNFQTWFQLQKYSPLYTDMAHRFLEDTIRFLHTGRRQISIQNWSTLINYSHDLHVDKGDSDLVKEFFGISDRFTTRTAQNHNLVDIAQKFWTQGGLTDLVYT